MKFSYFLQGFEVLFMKSHEKANYIRLAQKYAITKKSTIFTQSKQNFVSMWYLRVPYFDKVSW